MSALVSFGELKGEYFDNNKSSLVVVLPKAATTIEDYSETVSFFSNYANVLYVSSGYYGITNSNNTPNPDLLSKDNFSASLMSLLTNYSFDKLIFVCESVGCLQAINFTLHKPGLDYLFIFSNPAIYKSKFIRDLAFDFFLKLSFLTSPRVVFNTTRSLIKVFGNNKILDGKLKLVSSKIGAYSYLACLREIFLFPFQNKNIDNLVNNKSVVLVGSGDFIFSSLCDREFCKKHSIVCKELTGGHGLLGDNPQEAFTIIEPFIAS